MGQPGGGGGSSVAVTAFDSALTFAGCSFKTAAGKAGAAGLRGQSGQSGGAGAPGTSGACTGGAGGNGGSGGLGGGGGGGSSVGVLYKGSTVPVLTTDCVFALGVKGDGGPGASGAGMTDERALLGADGVSAETRQLP